MFNKNDRCQRDIINKIKVITKICTYTIHDLIPLKYQKYPYTTIMKHVNVLDKVNKSPQGNLHNMMTHDAYNIIIHVRTVTLEDISHEQKE